MPSKKRWHSRLFGSKRFGVVGGFIIAVLMVGTGYAAYSILAAQNPQIYFTINGSSSVSVPAGSGVTLSWSVSNMNQAGGCDGRGGWGGNKGTSGSETVYPSSTINYNLICRNGNQVSDSTVTAYVEAAAPPPPPPSGGGGGGGGGDDGSSSGGGGGSSGGSNPYPCGEPHPHVALGQNHACVRHLRWYLQALGYFSGTTEDATLNNNVSAALRAFQNANGLSATGNVNAGTWDRLHELIGGNSGSGGGGGEDPEALEPCPVGTTEDSNGDCVEDGDGGGGLEPCPIGTTEDESGDCVEDGGGTLEPCPEGSVEDANGDCIIEEEGGGGGGDDDSGGGIGNPVIDEFGDPVIVDYTDESHDTNVVGTSRGLFGTDLFAGTGLFGTLRDSDYEGIQIDSSDIRLISSTRSGCRVRKVSAEESAKLRKIPQYKRLPKVKGKLAVSAHMLLSCKAPGDSATVDVALSADKADDYDKLAVYYYDEDTGMWVSKSGSTLKSDNVEVTVKSATGSDLFIVMAAKKRPISGQTLFFLIPLVLLAILAFIFRRRLFSILKKDDDEGPPEWAVSSLSAAGVPAASGTSLSHFDQWSHAPASPLPTMTADAPESGLEGSKKSKSLLDGFPKMHKPGQVFNPGTAPETGTDR